MIFLFCFVSVYLSQIVNVNLSVNSNWTQYQQGSYNLTYNVTETNSPYISVHILLTQQNPNFMLVSKEGSPVVNFNQSFIQGQTIDIISVLENRLSRFLLIQVKSFPIYISTLDETTKSSYQIIIQASDFIVCDNNCSNNGQCNDKGCVCNYGFIGNDCHQNAEEINVSSETSIILQNHAAFFYIELTQYQGNKMTLDIEIDEEDNEVNIYQLKTQSVVLPTELKNIDDRMFDQYKLNTSNPLTLYFDIPENISSNKRIVFAAIPKNSGVVQIINTLIVSLTFDKDGSSVETYIIVISIVIPIVLVMLLASFVVYKLKKKKEMAELAESRRREQYLAPTFSIPQVPVDIDRHLIQVNQKEINPDETCSICLENLVCNGKDLISTLCMHTFHKSCIVSWTQNHKECPICRSNLIAEVPPSQI